MKTADGLNKRIVALALPAFAALVAEPLFLLADSAIVGRLGTPQLAALGIAGTILSTTVGIFVFLAYGSTAVVSRHRGAGHNAVAMTLGVDAMWLALILGTTVAGLGWVSAQWLAEMLGATGDVLTHATTYLQWSMPGLPFILLLLAATGVLRGSEDTVTPMVLSIGGSVVNVAASYVLVYPMGMGIAGSALGTAGTQALIGTAGAFIVVRTARRQSAVLWPRPRAILGSAQIGMPLLVRTLTLRAALVITTFVTARQGEVSLAAHQGISTIWTFAAFALDALAIAGQTLTGNALGAGRVDLVRVTMRRMLWWACGGGFVLGLLIALGNRLLPQIFTTDPDVIAAASPALVVVGLSMTLGGYVWLLDGVLIGAGDGKYLAWAGVITLVAYAPLALSVLWFAPAGPVGLAWLWVALSVGFMGVRAVTLGRRAAGSAWMVTGVN